MSFLSRGSRRGQGRRRPNIWKEGAKKRIRFSVHFDANSDEFNELIRTGHLFLSGQNLTQPMLPAAAAAAPLQPHPSILEEPRMFNLNENKGWDANRNAPYSGNIGWNAPDPNHQHVNTSPCAASVNSSSHSKDNAKNPCSPQPVRHLDLKGKQPLSKSPAGMTEKPHQTPLVSVRSEAPSRMAEKPLDLKGKQPLSKSPSRMAEKPHQTPLVSVHSEAPSRMAEKPLDLKGKQPLSKSPSRMAEKPHQTPLVSAHSEAPSRIAEKPHQTALVSAHSEAPSRMAEKPLDMKGKKPLSKSPSRMAEKPHQTRLVSLHSEADSVREEMKGREDISHLDLFPEISSF